MQTMKFLIVEPSPFPILNPLGRKYSPTTDSSLPKLRYKEEEEEEEEEEDEKLMVLSKFIIGMTKHSCFK